MAQSGQPRFAFVALLLLALPVVLTFHVLYALPRLAERNRQFWAIAYTPFILKTKVQISSCPNRSTPLSEFLSLLLSRTSILSASMKGGKLASQEESAYSCLHIESALLFAFSADLHNPVCLYLSAPANRLRRQQANRC